MAGLTSLPSPQQPIADNKGIITRPWYMALVQLVQNAIDYVVGPSSAADGQYALFDGTSGKVIKAATGTGVAKGSGGVASFSDVTLAEIVPATAASRLIGRRSGSSGDWEEVSLDAASLSMSASAVLSALTGTGVATSVLGRAANSSGARADIQATVDNQVFVRRSSTLVALAEQSIGYWSPLTDTLTPAIIFDSFGDTVSVWTAL